MNESLDLSKIKLCIDDVSLFKDLIEINDSENKIGKRYLLAKAISGDKIKNRTENLLIACWMVKDHWKKDIEKNKSKKESEDFENEIYKDSSAQMIQYLANSIKHKGVEDGNIKINIYKTVEPRLGQIVLILSNNSFPGELKPFFRTTGDAVPEFDIKNVFATIGDSVYSNFDTMILSMQIVDIDNKVIGSVVDEVSKYTDLLLKLKLKFGV